MQFKDTVRLALGSIQIANGNNKTLQWITDRAADLFQMFANNLTGEIWVRNSSAFNAHIPFFSDIDITLIHSNSNDARSLLRMKKIIPVIGEINFYHPKIQHDLIALANPYELMRDPILCNKFKIDLQLKDSQLISFFIHQLKSDQKWLVHSPHLRAKKWRYLSGIMQKKLDGVPNNTKLIQMIPDDTIKIDIFNFLNDSQSSENIHTLIENASWKYLWPQAHIWDLNSKRDISYLNSLDRKSIDILLEQIKWEFWGIGCHHYWLDKSIMTQHLERMLELYSFIDPSLDAGPMKRIINFIQEANPSNQ